ncbi:hypothetical protein Theam_1769 (plasmid) [Thermovibrio ammonificans HB-1]|uniref:Uncharacterized protein n=1 Tax=Thermovibrio ammonificans (strain DSM 15698 / JCM 12110 / HB-1) TaxID=648996 RepID=E8T704_THEA1|nr:hypothetical protein [Thermovibrio ammonificans]ADU97725.1 hypothetical protein Theam_1769 [Thermovibrio ammonificans HB-1]
MAEKLLSRELHNEVFRLFYEGYEGRTLPSSLYTFACNRVVEEIDEVEEFFYHKGLEGLVVELKEGVSASPDLARRIEKVFWNAVRDGEAYRRWKRERLKELILEKAGELSPEMPLKKALEAVNEISRLVGELNVEVRR